MNQSALLTESIPRAIAFYLPQFHPIPENDEWWGKGFTEWRNVAKSRPKFTGHVQPRLPADLGFYDLRLEETRVQQAELARSYGVHGFCYYHYWFNGRRLLERPMDEMLRSNSPEFPFCICWANENWTRRWDGQDREVLMEQRYSPSDDLDHIRFLAPMLSDSRYIRVNGRPLFLIYRTESIPNPQQTADIWREEAMRLGVGEIFLARVDGISELDPASIGFDASIEFAPSWRTLPNLYVGQGFLGKVRHRLLGSKSVYARNFVYQYGELAEHMMKIPPAAYPRFRCACPSWDNSPRRTQTNAQIFLNPNPKTFERWVTHLVSTRQTIGNESAPIFINAWNEWAECAHLEPCDKYGMAFLEALRTAIVPASLR